MGSSGRAEVSLESTPTCNDDTPDWQFKLTKLPVLGSANHEEECTRQFGNGAVQADWTLDIEALTGTRIQTELIRDLGITGNSATEELYFVTKEYQKYNNRNRFYGYKYETTSFLVSSADNHLLECKDEFGDDALVADWDDILAMSFSEVQTMLDEAGIFESYNGDEYYFVTSGGETFDRSNGNLWGRRRAFFFENPSPFEVDPNRQYDFQGWYDTLRLASWVNMYGRVLCKYPVIQNGQNGNGINNRDRNMVWFMENPGSNAVTRSWSYEDYYDELALASWNEQEVSGRVLCLVPYYYPTVTFELETRKGQSVWIDCNRDDNGTSFTERTAPLF